MNEKQTETDFEVSNIVCEFQFSRKRGRKTSMVQTENTRFRNITMNNFDDKKTTDCNLECFRHICRHILRANLEFQQ